MLPLPGGMNRTASGFEDRKGSGIPSSPVFVEKVSQKANPMLAMIPRLV